MSFLRRRKGKAASDSEPPSPPIGDDSQKEKEPQTQKEEQQQKHTHKKNGGEKQPRWSCVDSCCWFIGFICSIWWFLLFLYNAMPASFPQYVTEAITGPMTDPPGVKLRKEGLTAKHPVVFVPGIVTGGLELWEGHSCADGLFRKRLWGGTFGELYKRRLPGLFVFQDDAVKGNYLANATQCDVWTEYHEMGVGGVKAVADYKVYTAGSILDLFHFVAPKLMARGDNHFSYGIADNLDDPKYEHYKYWSNPLETKLPNAPDMEIYSMYGVGIPTERAYVYKLTPSAECYIPFQIDTSAEGGSEDPCLKGGIYSTDGDETVPVLSAGFMCAKGWRGKTRFNPAGIPSYIREYDHAPPANLLEGRGTQSGAHVDIMGNFALIEDVLRVAAGATGEELGGDKVHSDIFKWSERINLDL
ncbi:hypothetical protein C1H46_030599 [Malus baccata]|uniref:Phospholipid:diacylglycerol acyltransferase n=1 Tax=Malus baccata TaxID=106549 RepID=A0A540LBU5_MALBA|nr:hypothetical protein C1H46_030599 [Malus baccata]